MKHLPLIDKDKRPHNVTERIRDSRQSDALPDRDDQSRYATTLLLRFLSGEEDALGDLFEQFTSRHRAAAERAVHCSPIRDRDGDDVLQSLFFYLLKSARQGKYRELTDTESFEKIVFAILKKKLRDAIDRETRLKRGSGQVVNMSALEPNLVDQFDYRQSEASVRASIDEIKSAISSPRTREIAELTLMGYGRSEIAQHLGIQVRSVYRRLETARLELREAFDV